VFRDRNDAGRQLAAALRDRALPDPVVLGLPRGGVAVAAVVAAELGAPLDVVLVRKVGAPRQPELALAAIGEDGALARNEQVLASFGVDDEWLGSLADDERRVLDERTRAIRSVRAPEPLAGRDAVVVDDGIATGATARAACAVLRTRGVRRLVVATPVGSDEALAALAEVADDVVCVERPGPRRFGGVGRFYVDFSPVPDSEVLRLVRKD
jgi:putative phosphoribosyl transferase